MVHTPRTPAISILASLLSLALSAAACRAAPTPTATPEPTPTPTPTPSAWLLGYDYDGLSLYDVASGQRADLNLPLPWMPDVDLRTIPSSGLLAVRVAEEGSDLVELAVLRLPEGNVIRRIPLLSEELVRRSREDDGSDWALYEPLDTVTGRWFKPRWSPDGTRVAFSAALEDSGADLYLYDAVRDELRRLTDEIDQAVALGWSPDGEWVVYAEAIGFEDWLDYFPLAVGAASSRTGEVRRLFEPISDFRIAVVGWPSADEVVLVAVDPYGEMLEDMFLMNLTSGEATALYEGPFNWVDLDPESGALALTQWADFDVPNGMAIMLPGKAPAAVPDPWGSGFWGLVRWYPEVGLFFAESDAGLLGFTAQGAQAVAIEGETCLPAPSPDGRYLAVGSCEVGWFGGIGLRIYTADGRLVRELESDQVGSVAWAPASDALYYLVFGDGSDVLLRAAIPSGEIRTVDRNARSWLALVQLGEPQTRMVQQLPTPAPTAVPTSTPRVIPTPTPQRALDPAGPWLVGMSREGPVAINADGTGRTELFAGVPATGPGSWLDSDISSTGWVAAVLEGTEAQPRSVVVGRPGRGVVRQIPIMSRELQAGLDQTGQTGDLKRWSEDVYLALDADAGWAVLLSWSPDGRTLAYLAAVDGPSADVYVYDTETDQTRRLTRGPNQPRLLGWSGDGRWILHLEIKDIQVGDGVWWDTLALWAAAADGSEVRKVPGVDRRLSLLHWGEPSQFLVVHYENGPLPPFQIELVDLNAGPVATLYPDYVYQWAIDPETGTVAFVVDPYVNPQGGGLLPGLYLASPARPEPQAVGYAVWAGDVYQGYTSEPVWSPELGAFMVTVEPDAVDLLSTAGEVVRRIEGVCSRPAPSPDGRWLAFRPCGRTATGLELRSEEDGRSIDLALGPVGDFFWRPDSSGIYYFQGEEPEQVLFVPVPEGTPQLIHADSGLRSGYWRPRFVEGP